MVARSHTKNWLASLAAFTPAPTRLLAVTLVFGLLSWAGVTLTREESRIAAVWFPNAMLVAVLLRGHGRRDLAYIPAAFAANVVADMIAGDAFVRAAQLSLVNSLEIGLIWWAMHRLGRPRPDMSVLKDVMIFAGVGALAAPLIAGALAVAMLSPRDISEALSMWRSWTLTDGMGMLILAPSIMIIADAWQTRHWPSRNRLIEIAAILLAATGTTIYVFWQTDYPFLFLDAPIVLLYAFRLGSLGTAISIINVAIIATIATSLGHGPINLVRGDLSDKILVLQIFLASSFAMGLPVAATLAAKGRIEDELRHRQSVGRSMIENLRDVIFRIDQDGRWESLNSAWTTLTGFDVDDSMGAPAADTLYPGTLETSGELLPQLLSGGKEHLTYWHILTDASGIEKHVVVNIKGLYNKDGDIAGAVGNIRDVSDERRATRALSASETRFQRLSDCASVGIFRSTADHQVTYVNQAWSDITGLSQEESLGQGWAKALANENDFMSGEGKASQHELSVSGNFRVEFRRPNGELVITKTQTTPELDSEGKLVGFVGIVIDNTAEIEAHQALVKSQRAFETLAALSPAGIFRTDAIGTCTYCNESWQTLTGLSPQTGSGLGWVDALHPDDIERVRTDWSAAIEHIAVYRGDFRCVRDHGEIVWLDVIASPELDDQGELVGYIGVMLDITARKALESQLLAAQRQAEDAALAKTSFLANMSHEIRTPMNGVLGFSELLLHSGLNEQQSRQAQLILTSGRAMMRLLNDILDISKVEAGQVAIAQEPINLIRILEGSIALMKADATRKGLDLTSQVYGDIPEHILGDELRLNQVLLNLIGNALKFTQEGQITVRLSALPTSAGFSEIKISVEDSGIGIEPDRLNQVFLPFVQADETTARRFGGTGLGLTISRQLVQLMGGDISVRSKLGTGSIFTVNLAARLSEAPSSEAMAANKAANHLGPTERSAGRRCHILLAEDHDVNQLLVSDMLDRLGHSVTIAADGQAAVSTLEHAARQGQHFDLVLMDIQMPNLDGYAAARKIRQNGMTPEDLPIVALTANAYNDDIAACLKAGMQDHLAKPLNLHTLAMALQKWLKTDVTPSGVLNPKKRSSASGSKIHERYQARRAEALTFLEAMLRRGLFTSAEIEEAQEMLHKLAGTAGMCGEPELGTEARTLYETLTIIPEADRGIQIPQAAQAFLRAA